MARTRKTLGHVLPQLMLVGLAAHGLLLQGCFRWFFPDLLGCPVTMYPP